MGDICESGTKIWMARCHLAYVVVWMHSTASPLCTSLLNVAHRRSSPPIVAHRHHPSSFVYNFLPHSFSCCQPPPIDPRWIPRQRLSLVVNACCGPCAMVFVLSRTLSRPSNEEDLKIMRNLVSRFSRRSLSVRANEPGGHWYSWEGHCCRSWNSTFVPVAQ